MKKLFLAFFVLVLSEAYCALAPFIKPCKSSDNQCLKESSQAAVPYLAAGIPELGVPTSDPIILKEINVDQGDLKLSFQDLKVVDLRKCKIESLTRDVEKSMYSIILFCPLHGTGVYKLDGKILVIPAQGEGNFELNSDKIQVVCNVKLDTVTGKDGAKHWKIKSYEYSYDLIEKVHFKFDNLFGGDESKAKAVIDIFDKNWKELITELGGPIIKVVVEELFVNTNKFFMAVPTSELEL